MYNARCKVSWKCIVITLIQSKISKFPVLNDVLIEEAVQCPALCHSQRSKVAIRSRSRLKLRSHCILLMSVVDDRSRTDGRATGGSGIARTGDREAAVGVTILSDRSAAKGRQNGGPLPSLTRWLDAHQNGTTVSEAPSPAKEFGQHKKGRCPVWTAPLGAGSMTLDVSRSREHPCCRRFRWSRCRVRGSRPCQRGSRCRSA